MSDSRQKTEEKAESIKKSIEEYSQAKFTGEIAFGIRMYQGSITAVKFKLDQDLT